MGSSQTAGGSSAYGGIGNTGMSFSASSFGQGASITIASSSNKGYIGGAGVAAGMVEELAELSVEAVEVLVISTLHQQLLIIHLDVF